MTVKRFLFHCLLPFAVAIVLTQCGEVTADPSASHDSRVGEKMVVFTWPDYIDMDVVSQFESETGIKVEFEYFDNLMQMKALMRSRPGHYDLVMVDDFFLAELIELQLLSPLKTESVPNIKNFGDRFMNREFDPGNAYSVPYLTGSVVVAYRKDKIQTPVQSWSIFWEKSLAGRIGLLQDPEDVYAVGLLSLGYPVNSNDGDQLDQATLRMTEHARSMKPVYMDLEDLKTQLKSGDLWATTCYSGDAATMAEENENIGYFIPSEGAPLWIDSWAIARDASNAEGAHRFINFMARGDVAAQNSASLWTATPNQAALPLLDAEIRKDETVYLSPELFEKCDFYGLPTAFRFGKTNDGLKPIMDIVHGNLAAQNQGDVD